MKFKANKTKQLGMLEFEGVVLCGKLLRSSMRPLIEKIWQKQEKP